MDETKNETAAEIKKTVYDGIKLTKKGADIIVITLTVLLFLFFAVAAITGA